MRATLLIRIVTWKMAALSDGGGRAFEKGGNFLVRRRLWQQTCASSSPGHCMSCTVVAWLLSTLLTDTGNYQGPQHGLQRGSKVRAPHRKQQQRRLNLESSKPRNLKVVLRLQVLCMCQPRMTSMCSKAAQCKIVILSHGIHTCKTAIRHSQSRSPSPCRHYSKRTQGRVWRANGPARLQSQPSAHAADERPLQ